MSNVEAIKAQLSQINQKAWNAGIDLRLQIGKIEEYLELPPAYVHDPKTGETRQIENLDALAELRREALLVLGYPAEWPGEIKTPNESDAQIGEIASLEQCLGRCLLRYLNKRARAN